MNVYKITYSVSKQDDLLDERKATAISYATGECPYEAIFYARDSLEKTSWITLGDEKIIKVDKENHEYHRMVVEGAMVKKNAITIIKNNSFNDFIKYSMIA